MTHFFSIVKRTAAHAKKLQGMVVGNLDFETNMQAVYLFGVRTNVLSYDSLTVQKKFRPSTNLPMGPPTTNLNTAL